MPNEGRGSTCLCRLGPPNKYSKLLANPSVDHFVEPDRSRLGRKYQFHRRVPHLTLVLLFRLIYQTIEFRSARPEVSTYSDSLQIPLSSLCVGLFYQVRSADIAKSCSYLSGCFCE